MPLGLAVEPHLERSDRVVVPYWPADPQLGPIDPSGRGVEVLMPGRWTPPLGGRVVCRRTSYLHQARSLPGVVDSLVVAASRDGDGWVLPWTYGTTGAVATHGVSRASIVEVTGRTVVPGAPRVSAGEIHVVGVAPPDPAVARSEAPRRQSDEVSLIASAVARLVPEASWLELGIGALPGAVLRHLVPEQVDGFICGVAREDLLTATEEWRAHGHEVPIQAAMVFAPERLVRGAVDAGGLELVSPEVSHAPSTEVPLVAVNGALSIDLTATVNTERSGGKVVSGRGGHPDFSRRAHLSPGGMSIVVLRSRDRTGASNIVPTLSAQERSTCGAHVDVVVTEHGLADLRGLDRAEQRAALISIAHPDDRAVLDRSRASVASAC